MEQSKKFRRVIFYKSYFDDFLVALSLKVQKKIIWTIELVEDLEMVPETYLKHLENAKGLYEIRVQQGKNNYRIFCFFEKEKLIVATTGFYKKTQKTPVKELPLAIRIKADYEKEKHTNPK
ncbi:MAG: type II toxin-antitoxin system RelE/ParE family toxin [Bacteroidota bacterium]|jgi:phage-related protein